MSNVAARITKMRFFVGNSQVMKVYYDNLHNRLSEDFQNRAHFLKKYAMVVEEITIMTLFT